MKKYTFNSWVKACSPICTQMRVEYKEMDNPEVFKKKADKAGWSVEDYGSYILMRR